MIISIMSEEFFSTKNGAHFNICEHFHKNLGQGRQRKKEDVNPLKCLGSFCWVDKALQNTLGFSSERLQPG